MADAPRRGWLDAVVHRGRRGRARDHLNSEMVLLKRLLNPERSRVRADRVSGLPRGTDLRALAFLPRSSTVAVAGDSVGSNGCITLVDTQGQDSVTVGQWKSTASTQLTTGVRDRLLVAAGDTAVALWSIQAERVAATCDTAPWRIGMINDVAYHENGAVAAGGDNGACLFHTTDVRTPIFHLKPGKGASPIRSVQFLSKADPTRLLICSTDTVGFCDLRMHSTFVDTVQYRQREPQASATAMINDLSEISVAQVDAWMAPRTFRERFPKLHAPVFDRSSGEYRKPFLPHLNEGLRSAQVLSAGSAVLTQSSTDHPDMSEIKLWDLNTGEGLVTFDANDAESIGILRPMSVLMGGGVLTSSTNRLMLFSAKPTDDDDYYERTRRPIATSQPVGRGQITAATLSFDGGSAVAAITTHNQLAILTQRSLDDGDEPDDES